MKKAAILCASGLGDGLLMMIAASQLKRCDYSVTIYHKEYHALKILFQDHTFLPYPDLKNFHMTFQDYDLVIIENDHSDRAWKLFELRDSKMLSNARFIFPTPYPKKTCPEDFVFNPKIPFATNLALISQKLCASTNPSKHNDLSINPKLTYRKFPQRVILHPTSQDKKRNWHPKQFLTLAGKLKELGYFPYFAVGPNERLEWQYVVSKGYSLPQFEHLGELLDFIYESGFLIGNDSGLGHLASNAKIPTLTISGNPKRVRLWRPDFFSNLIVTPNIPLPNFRGLGLELRRNFWQYFVPVNKVLKTFQSLVNCCQEN